MAIKLIIKDLVDISSTSGDLYSATITLQLIENGLVIAEQPITVSGDRYEADNLKEAVKRKVKDIGMQWREQIVKTRLMAKQLEGLAGEI